jgi:hypothetical protein
MIDLPADKALQKSAIVKAIEVNHNNPRRLEDNEISKKIKVICYIIIIKGNEKLKPRKIYDHIKQDKKINVNLVQKISRLEDERKLKITFQEQLCESTRKTILASIKQLNEVKEIREMRFKIPEITVKKNLSNLVICSLNVNNIMYKAEEISEFLEKKSPDCLLVQETRKYDQRKIKIVGYKSIEQLGDFARGRVGLMVFYKENLKITDINQYGLDNILMFNIQLAYGLKLSVMNIYNRNNPEDKKYILNSIKKIREENTRNKMVFIGDWNMLPSQILKSLNSGITEYFCNNPPLQGTRFQPNFMNSERCIDYSIATDSNTIVSQKSLVEYQLSDHMIVEVNINCLVTTILKQTEITTFDRSKLKESIIQEALKKSIDLSKIEGTSLENEYEDFK